ncbi:hypothetical protein M413DRAFT_445331 [Hebeloma cylindrosporum]|uniref:Zn(2)-C6 fungal-type domain-containing protein n=1 Tax=Hebeloma cylindrosporum TaxID=76867 RepID=A0A0C3BXI3_HEBCY|nr:hypothetical protein M413DRAFT_445331 [Hebeloma cylindrosporum h7]
MKAKSSGSGTGNPRGRGTYNPACDVCARKKTKCDGIKPVCQPCRQQGRDQECAWTKNPVRKPRTEQHFEAMHKRAENLSAFVGEYRKYADYLESLLESCQQDYHPHHKVDFRASRPSDPDGLLGLSPDMLDHDFDYTVMGADDHDGGSDSGSDPTKEICLPAQTLKLEEGGLIHHYGNTAPFRFDHLDLAILTSRFPALAENTQATYVLLVDGVSDDDCSPDFDWSRHLPSAVPLTRRSHDKALDLLFKFFTSWCLRIVPALFCRDMYRALSVPRSQPPPKTPHYSPMLHNALVALALAFLDEPELRDLKARQYFANTAKSFIEAECEKPNISVVHALSILASFHSSQGDQTLGYMYFGMSARMSQALGLNVDCSEWVRLGLIDEADKLDRNWANWTTFSQDICWSLYVGRDFCVSASAEAGSSQEAPGGPFIDQGFDQLPWVHPPSGMDPQPNNLTKTFAATCELLAISRRIMDVVNGLNRFRGHPLALDELISDIDLKLNTWKGSLDEDLEITVKSRPTATPHKLMLHLAYWWLFILLHRPFYNRKSRGIPTNNRQIDHVKLCSRAAENIMDNLATWRKLYTLRYCPITLIQAVFSAGTIYLLTAIHAGSGIRVAQKELRRSLDQEALVMQYLQEIGKSWQCATNIAGILKNLMHEQLRPLLERKTIPMTSSFSGALQVPDFISNDDSDAGSTVSRSSSTKGHHVRRRSSSSKINKQRRVSHSRNQSAGTPPISTSPTIMISPVQNSPSISYAPSSSSAHSVTAPIAIQSRSRSTTSFSSSPSSLPDPWLVQPNGTPSPNSSPVFSTHFSTSTSFERHGFQGYPHPLTYGQPPVYSGNGHGTNLFSGQGSLAANMNCGASHSPAPAHNYPGKELSGFFGMLGGQTLPQTPYVGFNLGDAIASFEEQPSSTSSSGDIGFVPHSPFGSGFPSHAPSLVSLDSCSTSSVIDNDTNMDDSSSWDFWAPTFD